MRIAAPAAPALFLLAAACSGEPTVTATNESAAEVDNRVAAAGLSDEMRPGRWEGTMTVTDSSPPGRNPAASPGKTETQRIVACVTPESVAARRESFAQQMVRQARAGCRYESYRRVGGRTEATMICDQGGVRMKSVSTSEFTEDRQTIRSTSGASASPGAGPNPAVDLFAGVSATSTSDFRRTGECRGDEEKM